MIKSFKCADVGRVCDWSAEANTIHELMQQIKEHARHAHEIDEFSEEIVVKVESCIKDI